MNVIFHLQLKYFFNRFQNKTEPFSPCFRRENKKSSQWFLNSELNRRSNKYCPFFRISKLPLQTITISVIFTVALLNRVIVNAADETGARFLRLGVGARELALGSAASAVTNDLNAIYWNPAGLSHVKNSQLGLSHSQWIMNTQYNAVVFAHPSLMGTWALSGMFLRHEDQEERGEDRTSQGAFSASDTAFTLAFSPKLSTSFKIGGAIKIIESRIGSDRGQAIAFDGGGQVQLGSQGRTVGAVAVRQWGSRLKLLNQADPLPLTTVIGLRHSPMTGLLLSTEFQFEPYDDHERWVFGSEFQVMPMMSLRGGYSTLLGTNANVPSELGKVTGLMGGLGLQWKSWFFDIVFEPFGELGDSHRFSLKTQF